MQDVSFVASVAVPVSIFVRRSPGTDFGMQPCVADEVADIGVSHQGSQDTLLPGHTGAIIAAEVGSSCKTYGETKTCEIFAGDTIAVGDKLKPDADGAAVPCLATEKYSAVANASAVVGEKVSVTVSFGVA